MSSLRAWRSAGVPTRDRPAARRSTPRRSTPRGSTRRLIASLAACGALALGASACSAAPYAATVNSVSINQAALNARLKTLASSKSYVRALDRLGASRGFTVTGDAAHTYNNQWVDGVLTQMIVDSAIHQYLAAHHHLPGRRMLEAARAVDEAQYGSLWLTFPASFRRSQVQSDAEHAEVEPVSVPRSTLLSVYHHNLKYFYTRVCIRQVAFAVRTASGAPNYAASRRAALAAQASFDRTHRIGGSAICYSPATLERQPASVVNTVLDLAVGKASSPQRTGYGYRIIALSSRRVLPLGSDVARALSVALSASRAAPDAAVNRILARTHVKVNPEYGTWHPPTSSSGPGVVPPSLPSAGSSSGGSPSGAGSSSGGSGSSASAS